MPLLLAVASLAVEHGLSAHGLPWLQHVAQWLWLTGIVAPNRVGPSSARDRTRVPCIASWILKHWTTKEVLDFYFSFKQLATQNVIQRLYQKYSFQIPASPNDPAL